MCKSFIADYPGKNIAEKIVGSNALRKNRRGRSNAENNTAFRNQAEVVHLTRLPERR
jgi:hypothetical protein